jgi:CheY-like chemotaxis protein
LARGCEDDHGPPPHLRPIFTKITKAGKYTFAHIGLLHVPICRVVYWLDPGEIELEEDQQFILVIEDDVPIQVVVEDALTDGGFEPAITPSGEEAVTLLIGMPNSYCALVTDIKLRGKIDGWEVARKAREINPNFPVVYITAAHADQWPARGVPNSVLLTKPFAPAQLITAVSQLLNSDDPHSGL